MFKKRLCLALNDQFGKPYEEQIKLIKAAGFDGFAIDLSGRDANACALAKIGRDEGMLIPYLHAPFNKSDDMWLEGENGDSAAAELINCAEICAEIGVPVMVCHAFIGFDAEYAPTELGIERYGSVVRRASALGVSVAFENTEGEEFLAALMNAFKDEKSVGFCWDTGHELCYNPGTDMAALYGERLLVTHLNDNLGVRDFGGKTTFIDDLHLLPFDGIADWDRICRELSGFDGALSFELNTKSKPGRHENDCYGAMPLEIYLAEAFKRACRVAAKIK